MLELRSHCENCGKLLPNDSTDAMICTFECTFCSDCVRDVLQNVCPNCGGGLEKRPSRPVKMLEKNPSSIKEVLKPVDMEKFKAILERYKDIAPEKR